MVNNILELRNVTKTFGDFVAVDSVDFALRAGEIHAILGENGAGKSTLMNLIYGLYQPSEGTNLRYRSGELAISIACKVATRRDRQRYRHGASALHAH